jgi:hypothetical protein
MRRKVEDAEKLAQSEMPQMMENADGLRWISKWVKSRVHERQHAEKAEGL